MPIRIKLGELMAQEAAKRGQRVITLKQMEEEIKTRFPNLEKGVSRNTLAKLAEGEEVRGIWWTTLEPLCLYFDCQPGDLIKLENGGTNANS